MFHARSATCLHVSVTPLNPSGAPSRSPTNLRGGLTGTVSGAPKNPNKAHVISASLGSQTTCPGWLQSAINDVVAAGVTIVVAAGNSAAAQGDPPPRTPVFISRLLTWGRGRSQTPCLASPCQHPPPVSYPSFKGLSAWGGLFWACFERNFSNFSKQLQPDF